MSLMLSLRHRKSVDGDLQKTSPLLDVLIEVGHVFPTDLFPCLIDFSASRLLVYYQGEQMPIECDFELHM